MDSERTPTLETQVELEPPGSEEEGGVKENGDVVDSESMEVSPRRCAKNPSSSQSSPSDDRKSTGLRLEDLRVEQFHVLIFKEEVKACSMAFREHRAAPSLSAGSVRLINRRASVKTECPVHSAGLALFKCRQPAVERTGQPALTRFLLISAGTEPANSDGAAPCSRNATPCCVLSPPSLKGAPGVVARSSLRGAGRCFLHLSPFICVCTPLLGLLRENIVKRTNFC